MSRTFKKKKKFIDTSFVTFQNVDVFQKKGFRIRKLIFKYEKTREKEQLDSLYRDGKVCGLDKSPQQNVIESMLICL